MRSSACSSEIGFCLRFARCFEHGGVHRLARARARPHDELEGLVVAFASIDGGVEQHFALTAGGLDAAGEHECVAKHDHAVLAPQVEMAEPELLVDLAD